MRSHFTLLSCCHKKKSATLYSAIITLENPSCMTQCATPTVPSLNVTKVTFRATHEVASRVAATNLHFVVAE